jgi:glycosyltransferase involved in cell wall biosynthesis
MRVLLISDYSLAHSSGGAQRSNDLLMQKGREIGHIISEFNYDNNPSSVLNQHYDVVISSNLEAISNTQPDVIRWASMHPYHVRLEHDSNRYLTPEIRKALFTSCKKSFFLSKFHYNNFVESYGDYFVNVEIVADPIDSALFFDNKSQREEKTLYVGFMHPLKGTNDFLSFCLSNPDRNFVVAGWASDDTYIRQCNILPNVEILGKVDYSEMPKLYNKYTTMFYKPLFYEPFCRSVAEALMCGMKVESNDLIGSVHLYNEVGHDSFVSQCDKAPEIFWEKIGCPQQ